MATLEIRRPSIKNYFQTENYDFTRDIHHSHLSVSASSNSLFFLLLLLNGDVETSPGSCDDKVKRVCLLSDTVVWPCTGSQYNCV